MISSEFKALFVHIPKTAGQSIESVFLNELGLTWQEREHLVLKYNDNPDLGPPTLAHLTVSEYLNLGYLTEATFKSYYSFSIVRNPWDRLVSEYKYRKFSFSFRDFVLKYFPEPADDDHSRGYDVYRHVLPQSQFILDENGNQLVDYIGRFETLQNDFSVISNKVFQKDIQLPHKNRSNISLLRSLKRRLIPGRNRHYSQYYDQETRAFVAQYYADDIKHFDYAFEER